MKEVALGEAIQAVEYGLKSLATGYLPGHHRAAIHGAGGRLAGFASLLHRMDPRNIDMLTTRRALSPVPLVRLYQAKVAINVALLVDLSASMGFEGRTRKLQEAAKLAACLSYSAYRLGDRFTLLGFGDAVDLFYPLKRSSDYPWEIGGALWEHEPTSTGASGLAQACALLPRSRSLVVLVSDFHFDVKILEDSLARLHGHDLILAVLWDAAETEDPLRSGWTALYDPETGARARLWMRRGLAERSERLFEARRARLLEACRRFGAEATFLGAPLDPVDLSLFFITRRGMIA